MDTRRKKRFVESSGKAPGRAPRGFPLSLRSQPRRKIRSLSADDEGIVVSFKF
jgi:hypothetical protein